MKEFYNKLFTNWKFYIIIILLMQLNNYCFGVNIGTLVTLISVILGSAVGVIWCVIFKVKDIKTVSRYDDSVRTVKKINSGCKR